MASRHRRPAAKPLALGAAGAGLVGALVLTGPAPAALFNAVANTLIVVGGNSDPTSQVEWDRIRGTYSGPAPVLISYPADVGVGFPGLPPLSLAGRDTYAGSVDKGSDTTAAAINAGRQNNGDVTVYALSLGTDVVGVALVKTPKRPGDGTLTVVQAGSPSFVNSGIWNLAPPFIPGLRNGPAPQGPAGSDAKITSICIKGDSICGLGTNPITAAFYFLPGFDLHGKDYTAQKIGQYSPENGIAFTPDATGIKTPTKTVTGADGVQVDTYDDGTVKKTWTGDDGVTYVSIDTGQNPWGRLLRENGIPVPIEFDKILSAIVPVPEPGATGPLSRPAVLADAIAAVPTVSSSPVPATEDAAGPASRQLAQHDIDRPGTIPLTTMLAQDDAPKQDPVKNDPVLQEPTQDPVQQQETQHEAPPTPPEIPATPPETPTTPSVTAPEPAAAPSNTTETHQTPDATTNTGATQDKAA
ncbi:PE-PPE domain-containing protein [Tsukamurella sp. NPDC003166]|uniref:PE-PPE domain-containing protein n=1 Tax=Tsukamurella sp. NPDC003166 TaxID=3154444 RepID=UPI0033BBF88B